MSSAWEVKKSQSFKELRGNIECEVVVVGGGLAGLWCAYLLSTAGKKVVLVEKDKLGGGETFYTTAFLTQSLDTSLVNLVKMFGEGTAKLIWKSGKEALMLVEETIKKEDIVCEYKKVPNTIFARTEDEYHDLEEEHKWARRFGFDTTLRRGRRLGFKHFGVLDIENQAKYHPMLFFYGLLEGAIRNGVQFYEDTEVLEVLGRGPMKVVTTDGETIRADQVVIATYEPFNNPKPIHFKKGMYISYVNEFSIKPGILAEGMYIDMSNPYHYFRVDKLEGETRFILGGEDHREDIRISPSKNFKALIEYAEELFPLVDMKLVRRWKGKILEPSDGLALIGEVSPSQYIATAFSGNGMTYAPLSAMIIRDQILGVRNAYTRIYDPKRKLKLKALVHKARDYTGELVGGVGKNIFR